MEKSKIFGQFERTFINPPRKKSTHRNSGGTLHVLQNKQALVRKHNFLNQESIALSIGVQKMEMKCSSSSAAGRRTLYKEA